MEENKECPRTSERVAAIDAKFLARKDTPQRFKSAFASGLRLRQKSASGKRGSIRHQNR